MEGGRDRVSGRVGVEGGGSVRVRFRVTAWQEAQKCGPAAGGLGGYCYMYLKPSVGRPVRIFTAVAGAGTNGVHTGV